MISETPGYIASEARVQQAWRETPFPQSRIPAYIEISIRLVVCLSFEAVNRSQHGSVETWEQRTPKREAQNSVIRSQHENTATWK